MSSFILKRSRSGSSLLFQNPKTKSSTLYSSQLDNSINSNQNHTVSHSGSNSTLAKIMQRNLKYWILASGYCVLRENISGFGSNGLLRLKNSCGSNEVFLFRRVCRCFSTQAAVEPSTSDGLTVDGIVASQWTILDESEGDWKSHAAAIAQSIQVIKKRLQV